MKVNNINIILYDYLVDVVIDYFSHQEEKQVSYNNIKQFNNFLKIKNSINNDTKILMGVMNISKGSLISEFSLKSFYSGIDLCKDYLIQQQYSIQTKKESIDIEKMIEKVRLFDEKSLISRGKEIAKNVLPMNNYIIFQHIDKSSNFLNEYNAEKEAFNRYSLTPIGRDGFIFLPYSRSINFLGGIFISGGYENNEIGNTTWLIENNSNLCEDEYILPSPFVISHTNLLSKVPSNNIVSDKTSSFKIMQLSNMNFPRAGHSLVGVIPNLIIAVGGVNNNATCEAYIVEENKWEEISPLQQSRIDANILVYNNYIYVFGGIYFNLHTLRYEYLNSFERLSLINPRKSNWEYVFPKFFNCGMEIVEKSNCGIVSKNEDVVYIVGGQVGKNKYTNDILEFNLDGFIISVSEKKLPKKSCFLEKNFIFLFKDALNFDFEGDLFTYNSENDSFSFTLQK